MTFMEKIDNCIRAARERVEKAFNYSKFLKCFKSKSLRKPQKCTGLLEQVHLNEPIVTDIDRKSLDESVDVSNAPDRSPSREENESTTDVETADEKGFYSAETSLVADNAEEVNSPCNMYYNIVNENAAASEDNNSEDSYYDEFYESIQAPMFFDFSRPEPPLLDEDHSWFCVSVGCDQQHEETDTDAVFESFRLRVLEARMQKALSKRALSTTVKCALSAPAKRRVSRQLNSSISRSIANSKANAQNPLMFTATTSQKKQNPKSIVCEAHVINSPSKKERSSSECSSQTADTCVGTKKLAAIGSQKKTLYNAYGGAETHTDLSEQAERKMCKSLADVNHQKATEALGKTSEGSCASAFHGIKYKKLMPTISKPFRLRTDERATLREKNMELHP